ncbi:MAG: thioredoxin [Kistimonas sp.]|nr:thioredoxin [Kistimonas sp.]
MSQIITITEESFDKEVIECDDLVLVDFWAPWCGPCNALTPVIEELARETPDMKVCKLDVEANQDFAAKQGIRSIPTLRLYHRGQEVGRHTGTASKQQLIKFVAENHSA